ncbi:PRANC domain protein [Orientia tsutsugamushi str. UT76]|nr:PRANC domain protein [Orientia tsutsugamushi str. UT76]
MLSAFLANTTDDNESSRYINDPKVQEIYECCEEKFPIYSCDLKKHIDAGSTRNQLLHGHLNQWMIYVKNSLKNIQRKASKLECYTT